MAARKRSPRQRRPELSQHFLKPASAATLVRAMAIQSTDLVLEIGSGRGALTSPLLQLTSHLRAWELDAYLAEQLQKRLPGLQLIQGDFLVAQLPDTQYKVVGNIPYNRSNDIVRKLAFAPVPPEDCYLLVQREFAERLCGPPYGNESLLSLQLKLSWHVEIIAPVKRSDFLPAPRVESCLLWLQRSRPLLEGSQEQLFLAVTGDAFKRGTLRALDLSNQQLRRLAADYRFAADSNPAHLSLAQWLGITRFVYRTRQPGNRKR